MISAAVNKKIRTYKGLVQLAVTADFPLGSITKIYGPSGAGKTTFLKILAGLTGPEQGSISFEQEVWLDTEKQINQTPQQRKVGFVFQDYALFPNMTVLQHLEYASTENDFILRLLKLGQMEAFQQHRPKHLSGGQQQRLAILRALATKPRLLLMDEAFSALDDDLRQNLITGLKPLLEEFGTTTIIVSHHAEETAGFANRDLKID